ncbi:ABC transporter permease [Candidatus Berkelbacteria bacterium]|nr:ABC transporter permease [Candidatus Berkelbacteria bacterium]
MTSRALAAGSVTDTAVSIITPPKSFIELDLAELWRFRELLFIFAWRDLKVRYKQTALGLAWALFQPFITMVVFTFFFGRFLGDAVGGVPYPVFVFLGLVFWNYFSQSLSASSGSLVEHENIIKKVYFPRLLIPIASTLAHLVDFVIALVILGGIVAFFHITPALVGVALLPVLLLTTFLTAIGVGLFLAAINVKYRDVRYVVPFFIQLLLFVTPVIYPAAIIGEAQRWLLVLNPVAGVIETARASILTGVVPWSTLGIALAISLTYALAGLAYFRRTERFFADVI